MKVEAAFKKTLRDMHSSGRWFAQGALSFAKLPIEKDPLHTCIEVRLKQESALAQVVVCMKDVLYSIDIDKYSIDIDKFLYALCVELNFRLYLELRKELNYGRRN